MFKLGKMIETFANKTPVAVLVRAVLQRELDTNAWTGSFTPPQKDSTKRRRNDLTI